MDLIGVLIGFLIGVLIELLIGSLIFDLIGSFILDLIRFVVGGPNWAPNFNLIGFFSKRYAVLPGGRVAAPRPAQTFLGGLRPSRPPLCSEEGAFLQNKNGVARTPRPVQVEASA